jgi:homoserine dehydrogenase
MSTTQSVTPVTNLSAHPGIIVLKLGGSVLASDEALPVAVHEIDRFLRTGLRVVVVVSAIGDTTDSLIARAQAAGGEVEDPDVPTLAALLATGEHTSAALLTLALRKSGITACTRTVDQLKLIAKGERLNADPVSLDTAVLHQSLERHSVVVVPGFLARLADGSPATLGRGGSDLTAIFIGQRLGVPVRLAKDVDGLYQWDPAREPAAGRSGQKPKRFATLTYDDALGLDGGIVQHKAVRFAKQLGVRFTVGGVNRLDGTVIGAPVTTFATPVLPKQPLRVGLLGLGTVGLGVARHIGRLDQVASVRIAAVRTPAKYNGVVEGLEITDNVQQVAEAEIDVLIDACSTPEASLKAIRIALSRGVSVITASKVVAGIFGLELAQLAAQNGAAFVYSAAVGGGVPVLETIDALRRSGEKVTSVRAVINGTTNFVLDKLAEGRSPEEAVALAQERGYAEADPTADLSGLDAARKLAIIARAAFGTEVDPERIERTGIEALTTADAAKATAAERKLRLEATLERGRETREAETGTLLVEAKTRIAPRELPESDPLATAKDAENVVLITISASPKPIVLRGLGAGRWPTAQSVIGDLLTLVREGTPVRTAGTKAGTKAGTTAGSLVAR